MPDVMRSMQRHGVTVERLAVATARSVQTVMNWRTGATTPPIFIEMTIEAVAAGLSPVTHEAMYAHRLVDVLGVPKETEWTWRYDGKFPTTARLAIALIEQRPLTAHERGIIRNVIAAGAYYRRSGGWRARPIMGKQPPDMKPATPSDLIWRGYLKLAEGRLTVTAKGREATK